MEKVQLTLFSVHAMLNILVTGNYVLPVKYAVIQIQQHSIFVSGGVFLIQSPVSAMLGIIEVA
jgi:hypothetical protein